MWACLEFTMLGNNEALRQQGIATPTQEQACNTTQRLYLNKMTSVQTFIVSYILVPRGVY